MSELNSECGGWGGGGGDSHSKRLGMPIIFVMDVKCSF